MEHTKRRATPENEKKHSCRRMKGSNQGNFSLSSFFKITKPPEARINTANHSGSPLSKQIQSLTTFLLMSVYIKNSNRRQVSVSLPVNGSRGD